MPALATLTRSPGGHAMTTETLAYAGRTASRRQRLEERIEYRLLLILALALFLPVAAFRRLLPRRSDAPRRSILAEAREAAHTAIPMAFMA